jgi:hypothetical protein
MKTEEDCPYCEYQKKLAQLWRHEAYKLSGHPFDWEPELMMRKWVSLTDEEIYEVYEATEKLVSEHWDNGGTILMFPTTLYQAFEAKLKERNK